MYPMDFEEFLWAMGDEMMMPFIKDCFEKKQPLGQKSTAEQWIISANI